MLTDYAASFGPAEVSVTQNKVLKGNTLAYESLGSKLSLLREMSKYGRSASFIEDDQDELLKMTVDDFRKVINTYMSEKEMTYLVVGDKATQLEEVKKLKGSVVVLDNAGNPIP
jgi:zinc protease